MTIGDPTPGADAEVERRLRTALHTVLPLLDPPGGGPAHDGEEDVVAVIEAEPVRAQSRTLLVAVACATALGLVTSLALVARGGNEHITATSFERTVRVGGALTPERVPAGLRFDSLSVTGGPASAAPTPVSPDAGAREVVLSDPADPNRHVRIFAFRNGDDGADWQVATRQLIETTVDGARVAAYGIRDIGVVGLLWAKDGHRFDLTSFGLDLDTLRTLATGVGFEVAGALAVDHRPAGMTVAYEGPMIEESLRVEQNWLSPDGNRSLLVTVGDDTPWSAPSFRLGRGEVVQVGGHDALYYDNPSHRTVAWLDPSGRPHQITAVGFDRAEVLDVADGLVPLDATHLRALRAQARPGGFPDQLPGTSDAGGFDGASPTTAVANAAPRPAGFMDTGVRAADVPTGHAVDINGITVVHTTDDRWVAVQTYIEAPGGDGCTVQPDRAGDSALLGWQAPCTGAHYAPDGACVDDRCVVGLRTIDIRVNEGRIEIDGERFHVGVPRTPGG